MRCAATLGCVAVAFAAALVAAPPLAAWSANAHEILCEITWRRLSPAGKRLVGELRRADPQPGRTFSASCAWADRVRHRSGSHPHTAAYHYVNVPAGAAGVDPQRDCPPPRRCVTWAIDHYAARLADRSLAKRERAEALKFVAHFVGDVHQPLHVGRAADRGGNTIAVDFLGDFGSCGRGKERNLHQVWDRNLLEHARMRWPDTAVALDRAITPEQVRSWSAGGPIEWANESHRANATFVYALPEPVERCGRPFRPITPAYADRAVAMVRERLQQSGIRLARLIDAAAQP